MEFSPSADNSSGATVGNNFQVNTYTEAGQYDPSAAMDAEGDFVIAWSSVNEDGSDEGVYAQRFNANGLAAGSQFQVNTYTPGIQQSPSVAMDAAGDFVIAWESGSYDGSVAQDGSGFGIYAQRYNASAATQGSEFRVLHAHAEQSVVLRPWPWIQPATSTLPG